MQNHNDTIKTSDTVLRKIYLSHFTWKGCVWEGVGDRTELQHIDPHSYGHQRFFPLLPGCSTGGLGPILSGCWFSLPHLISTGLISKLLNRAPSAGCWHSLPLLVTNCWISCALNYIIVQRPPSSCGCHKLHSFNSSTVKATVTVSLNIHPRTGVYFSHGAVWHLIPHKISSS